MKQKVVILISGRGSNMEKILENASSSSLQEVCTVAAVISNNSKAEGLKIAQSFGVPTSIIPSKGRGKEEFQKELLKTLELYHPDYIILAGFMKILSPAIIQKFPNRIINIHPADSAKYQGMHGYEWAFENRLPSTMITVHFVDEGVDTGDPIDKREVDLRDLKTLAEVRSKGLTVEHQFYSEVIEKFFRSKVLLSHSNK